MRFLSHVRYDHAICVLRAALCFCVATVFAGGVSAQDAYRISSGDKVALNVVAWDTVKLNFVEFAALNGTYSVGPEGSITVPLLGPVDVAGKALTGLGDELSGDLQARLGLAQSPSVSVSIAEYRPIYVLGAVRVPGVYPYSHGLTVQRAVALAGGLDTTPDDRPEGVFAAIRSAGSLREFGINIARERIRAARLKAEMTGEPGFDAPENAGHPDGKNAVIDILAQERSLFESRHQAHELSLKALDNSRTLLETEIAALEGKRAGQNRQVELLREAVGNMETLADRGLVRSPNLVALQRQLIDVEARQLDTETAVFRAKQEISELERERVSLEAERQLFVLRELQRSDAEIERLATRIATTRRLLVGSEALVNEISGVQTALPAFTITRDAQEGSTQIEAGPDSRLLPNDVMEVTIKVAADNG